MQSIKYDDLEGDTQTYTLTEPGLGARYFQRLNTNKEKLQQVDGTTGYTETNESVRTRAVKVALQLKSRSIKPTDTIAICSKEHADQTVAVLGILLAGSVIAPIHSDLSFRECYNFIQKTRPKLIFSDLRVVGLMIKALSEMKKPNVPIVTFGGKHNDFQTFEEFLGNISDPTFKPYYVTKPKEKIAFVLQTQGTAGDPKFVCVSQYFIFVQTQMFLSLFENLEKVVSFFPLCNLLQIIVTCVSFEQPVIRILTGAFTVGAVSALIHDLRIDHAVLGTDFAVQLCQHPRFMDFDTSCLRSVILGFAATSDATIKFLKDNWPNVQLLQMYLTTEVGIISAFSEKEHNIAEENPNSSGRLMPNIKIRITNLENSENLGPDMWGQLIVKSDTMMLGYWKDNGLSKNGYEKGYFKTGDVGQYDEDGLIYIQGSLEERIMIDGEFVVLTQIEAALLSHPYVREAAVIANDDEIVACIVRKSDSNLYEDKLKAYVAERLSDKKVPQVIKFLPTLPRTPSGKVKKAELRNTLFRARTKQSESQTIVP